MLDIDITQLTPAFLLKDKNGYAMAKAMETGLQAFCDVVQTGVDTLLDVSTMPEWRLDEMAEELGCPYDTYADVETKRKWIQKATPLFAAFGTPQAIYGYLEGFFDSIVVEEAWQYGGEPYHFRVTLEGNWTPSNETWARKAIETVKNERSVLDGIRTGATAKIGLSADGAVRVIVEYAKCGAEDVYCGMLPEGV